MEDMTYALAFLALFGVLTILYGLLIRLTGNAGFIPRRATHSLRDKDDVIRVGRLTMAVGAAIVASCGLMLLIASLVG